MTYKKIQRSFILVYYIKNFYYSLSSKYQIKSFDTNDNKNFSFSQKFCLKKIKKNKVFPYTQLYSNNFYQSVAIVKQS